MAKKKVVPGIPAAKTVNRKGVTFLRQELNRLLPAYYMIHDAIEGEQAIKGMIGSASGLALGSGNGGLPITTTNILVAKAIRYLPQPNPEDKSVANQQRYIAYVTRAVFYNVTGRTLEGLTGQIFLRPPIVQLPTELEVMSNDADGTGLTLEQTANRCVRRCISYGRGGLLVDYPTTDGPVTKQDIADGDIRPTFTTYAPWNIINWRTEVRGAKKVLTFLVLREILDEEGDDGFSLTTFEQYRVLSLEEDGTHLVEIYRKQRTNMYDYETYSPTDAKGKQLTYIPFTFIGAEDNAADPDKPPLYDLASLNIAHYRNSADYEESCFIVGQPTPVFSGLDEAWVKDVLKGSVPLGSRASVPLPVGAKAELLQAKENSMPIEAMKLKEAQMVAIGAKLVQIQKVARTATQQIIETTAESSPLSNISKNVSAAMVWALGVAADFVGTAKDGIKYELNKDFDLTSMTADDQAAVVQQWQLGAISFPEMRTVLRRAGTATVEDEAALTRIKADIIAGLIPDPALANAKTPPSKAPSDAGGPQPGPVRRQGSPGSTA